MRLLVAMTHFPFPPRTGSDVVAFNQLRLLGRRHQLHLVSIVEGQPDEVPPDLFRTVTLVSQPPLGRLERPARAALGLGAGKPIVVTLGESEAMSRAVAEALQRTPVDLILLFELSAIQYVPAEYRSRVVANIEDPPGLKLWRKLRLPIYRSWERPRIAVNALLNFNYERRELPRLGRALVLSEEDARAMRSLGRSNVFATPYGVEAQPPDSLPSFERRRPGMVAISGNMFHLPNVDGVLFFLERALPHLLAEQPEATVHLVGAEPDARIVTAARRFGDRVVITGRVPQIAEYLRQARVSVCPVRLRIGVQTKILEAMASGTPVVSTVEGNSGIGGTSGVHLWTESDPRQLARRVASLLRGERWAELSRGGLEIAARFSWQASTDCLEQHLEQVLASRARSSASPAAHETARQG